MPLFTTIWVCTESHSISSNDFGFLLGSFLRISVFSNCFILWLMSSCCCFSFSVFVSIFRIVAAFSRLCVHVFNHPFSTVPLRYFPDHTASQEALRILAVPSSWSKFRTPFAFTLKNDQVVMTPLLSRWILGKLSTGLGTVQVTQELIDIPRIFQQILLAVRKYYHPAYATDLASSSSLSSSSSSSVSSFSSSSSPSAVAFPPISSVLIDQLHPLLQFISVFVSAFPHEFVMSGPNTFQSLFLPLFFRPRIASITLPAAEVRNALQDYDFKKCEQFLIPQAVSAFLCSQLLFLIL